MRICCYLNCKKEYKPRQVNQKFCSFSCKNIQLTWNAKKRMKDKAIAYKGGKCAICGYNKSTRALTFHHLDPSKKDFTIAAHSTRSWASVSKELDKCILLCQNCHCEEHENLDALIVN